MKQYYYTPEQPTTKKESGWYRDLIGLAIFFVVMVILFAAGFAMGIIYTTRFLC